MSTDLAVRDERAQVALSTDQLKFIAHTEFVPKGLRGNLPAILACVATGREVGIGDMAALRNIHLIDGRPTFSAELMVLLVRRRGHSITGSVSGGAAVAKGRRTDTGDEMTAEWTLEMADRAGLASKQNWRKYPEAMLWARAVSQLCRMLFADVFAGGTYTPEELDGDALYEENVLDGERAVSDSTVAAATTVERGPSQEGPGVAARTPAPHPDVVEDAEFSNIVAGIEDPPGQFEAPTISEKQMKMIHAVVRELDDNAAPVPTEYKDREQPEGLTGWTAVLRLRLGDMGVSSRKDLTKRQAGDLIDWLEAQRVPFS